jgi:hypothetical protein
MAASRTSDTENTHVIFAHTQRAHATFLGKQSPVSSPYPVVASEGKQTLLSMPVDMQTEIFTFVRTLSAARVITISKEGAQMVSQNHEGYQNAVNGNAIRAAVVGGLKANSPTTYVSLPDWFFLIHCDALELIGKRVIELSQLMAESITNPSSFFQFIFDKSVLQALRKGWVTLDQLIDLLNLKGDPEANDTVYALFRSQESGVDLVARLSAVLGAEKELVASDVVVDKQFVATFLNEEIHGSQQRYEMYLDDVIALHKLAQKSEKAVARP